MEMFSKHNDSKRIDLKILKPTLHTVNLKEGTRPVCQQHFCASQRSQEVLYERIEKQLEADVIESAQSE